MRVLVWSIRRAGSWGYLAGSWREATPHFIIILMNIRAHIPPEVFSVLRY